MIAIEESNIKFIDLPLFKVITKNIKLIFRELLNAFMWQLHSRMQNINNYRYNLYINAICVGFKI